MVNADETLYYIPPTGKGTIQIYSENDNIWKEFANIVEYETGIPYSRIHKNCIVYLGSNKLLIQMDSTLQNYTIISHDYIFNLKTKVNVHILFKNMRCCGFEKICLPLPTKFLTRTDEIFQIR